MAPAKERMKKMRERMRNDPERWQTYLEKERNRDKLRRSELKTKPLSNSQKDANRRKIRDRVRAHRQRMKLQTEKHNLNEHTSPIGSYKCAQSFGKALNKVKQTLPRSPNKLTAVVTKLVLDVIGPEILAKPGPRKVPSVMLKDDEKNRIVNFFCQDDISRQAPGIKDCVTIRKEGEKKVKYQKRHMVMSVGEAYEEFSSSFPEIKVGKSTFYSLRPPYVLLSSDTPHNVCVCKYHFNVINLTENIRKVLCDFPKTHSDVLNYVSCDTSREDCMFGLCEKCANCNLDKFSGFTHLMKQVVWKQWEEDGKGRPCLKEYEENCENAVRELKLKLPHFKIHCYVKKVQSDYFKKTKNKLKPQEAVFQFDFAENYTLESQDEIQSAHWNHAQVSVFTCCIWFHDQTVKSYAVISDDKTHSKYSVWTFLKAIMENVKQNQHIEHVYIFTDNCAAQFKNKYTLSNLCHFETDFEVTAEWNFFASCHGKGAMDGVGGFLKRTAWTAVKSRKATISNAKELHEHLSKNVSNVKCLYVGKSQVEENLPFLDKRWENVQSIPQVQGNHHFRPYDEHDLLASKTSLSLMKRTTVFKDEIEPLHAQHHLRYSDVYTSSDSEDCDRPLNVQECSSNASCRIRRTEIKTGVFVLVEVTGNQIKSLSMPKKYKYAAVCQTEVDELDDVRVMFLKSVNGENKKLFKADDEDICFVKFEQLINKLPVPDIKPQGNRLYYEFKEFVDVLEKRI